MTIAPEVMTEFLGIFNHAEHSPAQRAQALVDLQAKLAKQDGEARSQAWDNVQKEWQDAAKTDPEIGGPNYAANLATANKVAALGGPAFAQALALTGMGNHPEMVRFFLKIAPKLVEPGAAPGGPAPATTQLSQADRLYPNQQGAK